MAAPGMLSEEGVQNAIRTQGAGLKQEEKPGMGLLLALAAPFAGLPTE